VLSTVRAPEEEAEEEAQVLADAIVEACSPRWCRRSHRLVIAVSPLLLPPPSPPLPPLPVDSPPPHPPPPATENLSPLRYPQNCSLSHPPPLPSLPPPPLPRHYPSSSVYSSSLHASPALVLAPSSSLASSAHVASAVSRTAAQRAGIPRSVSRSRRVRQPLAAGA